jgi:hypothetical protein
MIVNSGLMNILMKNYDEATEDFNKALSLDPTFVPAQRGLEQVQHAQESP